MPCRKRRRQDILTGNPGPLDRVRQAELLVTRSFGVDPHELYQPSRGPKPAADARQAMMYLAHVLFGLSIGQVGQIYRRDRKTVRHACRKFEDLRDDPVFDRFIDQLEMQLSPVAMAGLAQLDRPCAVPPVRGGQR
ncbi:hypothetical protein GWI72_09470 [Microvirga tunisiensis]|uniref:Chromosomal replication initiator DnaA C-terminal domain-containing protein n=1 Tax=Pannonibacter tanglangensis TaxID=2750084 RepID=A0A7X5J9N9_9HYPH|nr:hypothetical protein [Pannonibacter sp. XCT-53]